MPTILLLLALLTLPAAGSGLSVRGNQFVTGAGSPVVVKAVSWFGMETETMAPHGLWARSSRDMLRQMRLLGFNTVRIPFSNAALVPGAKATGIDGKQNPQLLNRSPLQVLDRIVDEAASEGLWVILDRHRPTPAGQTPLWYSEDVSEKRWIDDWVALARRYRRRPAVVGFELHNEPHGNASWGSGDFATDWRWAAERAGAAVLAERPDLLIFVQGTENGGAGNTWWGGNLADAVAAPVRLPVADRLVYVAHDYPPSVHAQPWFTDAAFPANLVAVWEKFWAMPALAATAPVMLGEFGSKLETDADRAWLSTLVAFLAERRGSFAYWSWNPNSADTGGILENDWLTVHNAKRQALWPLLRP